MKMGIYYFLVTLATDKLQASVSGTLKVRLGETREEVSRRVIEGAALELQEHTSTTVKPIVLFLCIEPNY